jgi:hypothetical protein
MYKTSFITSQSNIYGFSKYHFIFSNNIWQFLNHLNFVTFLNYLENGKNQLVNLVMTLLYYLLTFRPHSLFSWLHLVYCFNLFKVALYLLLGRHKTQNFSRLHIECLFFLCSTSYYIFLQSRTPFKSITWFFTQMLLTTCHPFMYKKFLLIFLLNILFISLL